MLTLAEANLVLAATLSKAQEMKGTVAASVCDAEGSLIAFQRMDGIYSESIRMAIGKAIAAAASRAASGKQSAVLDYRSVWNASGIGLPMIRRPGGLPIMCGGTVLGAIGVSGGATDQDDERCATAGLEALAVWRLREDHAPGAITDGPLRKRGGRRAARHISCGSMLSKKGAI
jgi:glc operon protein GlcG